MTREDSIRTKTWVTEDGRYLTVNEMTDDHLHNIRRMLLAGMPPGYNQAAGRGLAHDWEAGRESLLDYTLNDTWADFDRDTYAAAWLQIIDNEFARRQSCQ